MNGIPAPKNLETAIKHFEQNEFSKQFLGEDVRRHYASIYKIESNLYNRVITDWELKRYFDQA